MSSLEMPPWYERLRPSVADPVLNHRLKRRQPHLSADARRSVVFDLVTATKRLDEALAEIEPDRAARARLVSALGETPTLEEVEAALLDAGRDDLASGLTSLDALEVGEFEARRAGPTSGRSAPAARAPRPAADRAPSAAEPARPPPTADVDHEVNFTPLTGDGASAPGPTPARPRRARPAPPPRRQEPDRDLERLDRRLERIERQLDGLRAQLFYSLLALGVLIGVLLGRS